MANVSSSNGLEKRPKLRFPSFDEPYKQCRIGDIYAERSQRGASDMELLSVTMNDGVMPRSEIEGKDNSSEDKSNYKVVLTGDMVYNSMRMWQGANGISPCDGIVSPAYTVLMPKIPISNGYFAAFFKSPNLINEFRKNSQGMTSDTWNLKYPQIETIKVCIPALSEQNRVADMLRTLERRIAKQAQLVDNLKKYKRGLLNQIFSAISKGSQRRKLRELVHVSGGKTPSMSNSLYWNGDIVWISSKDMKSSRISGSELKITNLALNEMTLYHPGTLLLVARSGILKHSLPLAILEVDATINQDIKALQVHGCNAFYLYYAILSQEDNIIRTLVKTGTTVQSLMMDSFLNIEIPTPNIDQQQSIIDKLAKLEKYVDVQGKELSLLSQMRNGLLQQLFI
jgi:type I restriction enzyme S subunit